MRRCGLSARALTLTPGCAAAATAPTVTASATDNTATVTYTTVAGASTYVITKLKNGMALSPTVTRTPSSSATSDTVPFSLASDLGGVADEFSFQVVAQTACGVPGTAGTSNSVTVGLPGAPTWAATPVASVGKSTLSWTAPDYNARVGTRYKLQLWNSGGSATVGSPIALNVSGIGPFAATADLAAASILAGTYQYQLIPANTYGDGTASAKTTAVRSRESNASQALLRCTASASCGRLCLLPCIAGCWGSPAPCLPCPPRPPPAQRWRMRPPSLLLWAAPPA